MGRQARVPRKGSTVQLFELQRSTGPARVVQSCNMLGDGSDSLAYASQAQQSTSAIAVLTTTTTTLKTSVYRSVQHPTTRPSEINTFEGAHCDMPVYIIPRHVAVRGSIPLLPDEVNWAGPARSFWLSYSYTAHKNSKYSKHNVDQSTSIGQVGPQVGQVCPRPRCVM